MTTITDKLAAALKRATDNPSTLLNGSVRVYYISNNIEAVIKQALAEYEAEKASTPERTGQLELCASGLLSLLYQEADDVKQIRDYIVPELRKCLTVSEKDNNGWLDISTAPMDGSKFLACFRGGHVEAVRYNDEVKRYMDEVGDYIPRGNLTHWQPLPPAPTGE